MKYYIKIIAIFVVVFSLFSCTSKGDDDNDDGVDDDDDDNDDSVDDDEYLPEINENWSYEIIDRRAYDYSLSLDSDNNVYIVYYNPVRDDGWDKLFYAFSIDDWQVKQFPSEGSFSGGNTCSNLSSAVDSNGELHLLYTSEPYSELYYASFENGNWVKTLISSTIEWLPGSSLTVDESGIVHISYYEGPGKDHDLMYAYNSNGQWQYEVVDSGAGEITIYHQSVLKVINDNKYLAYIGLGSSEMENKIIVAKKSESEWEKSVIGEDVGSLSMDVEDAGYVHLVSYNFPLRISYYCDSSGEWTSVIVADEYVYSPLSLAVDSNSRVHFLHSGMDLWESKVKTMYVNNTSGEWISEEIVADLPTFISMAIDSDNKIHVAMNAGSYLVHLTREIEQE